MTKPVRLSDVTDDDEPNAVTIENRNHITIITLSRPHRKNAVDGITAKKLNQAFIDFNNDNNAYVAILYGGGDIFCAGADLHEVSKIGDGGSNKSHVVGPVDGKNIGPMGPSRMFSSKPVIAAVTGHAVAGGLELSLLCDLRVCEQDTVFGVFCRRWGVPLIDGGTVRLPVLIGLSRALDLILTGRPVRADEALAMGLANRVVAKGQCLNAAIELAETLCKFPQQCMNVDRASAYNTMYAATSLQNALSYEYEQAKHIIAAESIAGATRFSKEKAGRGGDFSLFTNKTAAQQSNTYESAQQARSDERNKHFSNELKQNEQTQSNTQQKLKAVFFDLGGVVFGSPVHAIIDYERSLGYKKFEINRLMAASQHWYELETGAIALPEFYNRFQAEIDRKGYKADIRHIFKFMNAGLDTRREMLHSIAQLRKSGYIVVAITNNWYVKEGDTSGSNASILNQYFDHIIESCVTKCRKPDRHIFDLACKQANVTPQQCVFLDDIGRNLIGAQKLGFTTIKVNKDYVDALKQLQYILDQRGEYKVDFGLGSTAKPAKQSKL